MALQAEVFFDRANAYQQVIDLFGKASDVASRFLQGVETAADVPHFRSDVYNTHADLGDPTFEVLEAIVNFPEFLQNSFVRIDEGSDVGLCGHLRRDFFDRDENFFLHTKLVYHRHKSMRIDAMGRKTDIVRPRKNGSVKPFPSEDVDGNLFTLGNNAPSVVTHSKFLLFSMFFVDGEHDARSQA
jgi:hypothetical protein